MIVEDIFSFNINLNSFPQIKTDSQMILDTHIKTDCLFLFNISYHNFIFNHDSFMNVIGFKKDDWIKIIFLQFGNKINLLDKFLDMCKIDISENETAFVRDDFFGFDFFVSKDEIVSLSDIEIFHETID